MSLNFDDFQKQEVKFDIVKLQKAYKELLAIKGFTSIEGISNTFLNPLEYWQQTQDITKKPQKLAELGH